VFALDGGVHPRAFRRAAFRGACNGVAPLAGQRSSYVAIAVVQFVRAGAISYGAPVLEIQCQIEALRVFTIRSLRLLFVFGVAVWVVPFSIVVLRSLFGVDLYAVVSWEVLLVTFLANAFLALGMVKVCALCAARWDSSPRMQRVARSFAGYNLVAAQDQLAKLVSFERE
jgi:hypothetical protein